MLIIYGSMLCPDCVQCRIDLDRAGVAYEFLDFADSLTNLRQFLSIREGSVFDEVRAKGSIGIPCIVDGEKVSLDWDEYVSQAKPDC